MLQVHADGSGTIDRDVSRGDIPFYTDFFIGLGEEAVLLEPEELREAIRRKLAEMLERYKGT
jgi:predicted DNA-binding transcriptional regulator YafY